MSVDFLEFDELLPDLVRQAASVAARGWPVLAVRWGSKAPAHSGSNQPNHRDHWLRSPAEVAVAYLANADRRTGKAGCQFAVMTGQPNAAGDALVALDADVDGDWDRLDDVLREAGAAAQQWAARTLRVQNRKSRGHLVGVVTGACPPTRDLAPGIEWRGDGGYVLLPGARHPDGGRYEVTRPSPPLRVPPGLVALAGRAVLALAPTPVVAAAPPDRPSAPPGPAYALLVEALRTTGRLVSDRGGSARAHCPGPTHDRGNLRAALSVRAVPGSVLVTCHGEPGCATADVLAALGLEMSDLFDDTEVVSVEVVDESPPATPLPDPAHLVRVEGLLVPRALYVRQEEYHLVNELARASARDMIEAAEVAQAPDKWLTGDAVLDIPPISVLWGSDSAPWTAAGQSTLLVGPDGTGKSTVCQHYAKTRLDLPGWGGSMLGEPVLALAADQAVLYLAADRPVQILEGFARGLSEDSREALRDRLAFWPGPPPMSLATRAGQRWLLRKVAEVNAGLLIIDSRKDMGDVTDPREVNRFNLLIKTLDADGVETLIPHHNVQAADDPTKRPELTQVFGWREVYSGMGSVLMIKGKPGSANVVLHQVKPIREKHAPVAVAYDQASGRAGLGIRGVRPVGDGELEVTPDDGSPGGASPADKARAALIRHAGEQGWAPAAALKEELGSPRLDRTLEVLAGNETGHVEWNSGRGPQSAYRWVPKEPS